jgi:hypothetical protein
MRKLPWCSNLYSLEEQVMILSNILRLYENDIITSTDTTTYYYFAFRREPLVSEKLAWE